MSQRIKTDLKAANVDLLDRQLKTALPLVCDGVVGDYTGLSIILDDRATPADITQALAIAAAHNPDEDTPEQIADKEGKAALARSLEAGDKADMADVIKALAYLAKRIP